MASANHAPATKSDLTKGLRLVRTELKGDIQRLDQKIDRVAVDLVKTQADVREIKHTLATEVATKKDIDRVIGHIDAFAKKAESYDRAAVLHGHTLTEHEEKLKGHESRISVLGSRYTDAYN